MRGSIGVWAVVALVVLGCGRGFDSGPAPKYEGPIISLDSMYMVYSDSGRVKLIIEAPTQWEYKNGNREFPEGVFIEFYEDDGKLGTTLKANEGSYNKRENLYHGRGDVVLRSELRNQQLNTEELFWDPAKKKIYTEKFVRIESEDELLLGEGLEASQDFSSYEILKPSGTMTLEDGEL